MDEESTIAAPKKYTDKRKWNLGWIDFTKGKCREHWLWIRIVCI